MKPKVESENLIDFLLFENRRGCMSLKEFSGRFGYPIKTLYDWKHRPIKYKAPRDLFIRFNRELFVRLDVLHSWLIAQNPDLPEGEQL